MEKMPEQQQEPLTVLEALRIVWKAEHYAIRGNGDVEVAESLDREALEKARYAVSEPNDPPGLRHCVTALLKPDLASDDRDDVMSFLDMLFDPEYRWQPIPR
jgi:hypothetical protein